MYCSCNTHIYVPPKALLIHREGQSNQNGFEIDTSLPAQYNTHRGDVRIFSGNEFAFMTKANNMYPVEDNRYAGEFSFAWKLADATGRRVYISKYAVGSTSMDVHWRVGGSTYTNSTNSLIAAIAHLNSKQIEFDLYVMFNQGENDSGQVGLANQYGGLYQAHLDDRFNMFDIKGYICTGTRTSIGTFAGTVHDAQETAMALRPNCRFIDCDDLDFGQLHYSAAGYEEVGLREKNAFLTLL